MRNIITKMLKINASKNLLIRLEGLARQILFVNPMCSKSGSKKIMKELDDNSLELPLSKRHLSRNGFWKYVCISMEGILFLY